MRHLATWTAELFSSRLTASCTAVLLPREPADAGNEAVAPLFSAAADLCNTASTLLLDEAALVGREVAALSSTGAAGACGGSPLPLFCGPAGAQGDVAVLRFLTKGAGTRGNTLPMLSCGAASVEGEVAALLSSGAARVRGGTPLAPTGAAGACGNSASGAATRPGVTSGIAALLSLVAAGLLN